MRRLRHMVSDKFQVRSTGPINPMTRQPIKGRKFGGGIRLGEMERDSLLAHGAAYVLHDRLHTCSDYTTLDACAGCGSILSAAHVPSGECAAASGDAFSAIAHVNSGTTLWHLVCPSLDLSTMSTVRLSCAVAPRLPSLDLSAMSTVRLSCAVAPPLSPRVLHPLPRLAGIAKQAPGLEAAHPELKGRLMCTVCMSGDKMRRVAVPYVFKYLATELAAMNIKMALGVAN